MCRTRKVDCTRREKYLKFYYFWTLIWKLEMETWSQLTDEEIKIGFVASCIESAADRIGCKYEEMLDRMDSVGLVEGYIYSHYDALHTESRNNLTENILETLVRWESKSE